MPSNKTVKVLLTKKQYKQLKLDTDSFGFKTISSYLRHLIFHHNIEYLHMLTKLENTINYLNVFKNEKRKSIPKSTIMDKSTKRDTDRTQEKDCF